MSIWIHSTIAATVLVATIAVAAAAATLYDGRSPVAAKADRLPVATEMAADTRYMTIESRGDGVSVLHRVPVTMTASN